MNSIPPPRPFTSRGPSSTSHGDKTKGKQSDPHARSFEVRPQIKQQTFDEIYGEPENFLEIEVCSPFHLMRCNFKY